MTAYISDRKEQGYIIVDGMEVATTRRCCHCGMVFMSRQGSGVRRGFCMCCMDITCGAKECDGCLPFEKRLDLYEKGKLLTL